MRGHDNRAGDLPREEHSNGQSSVAGPMRQTLSSQASRVRTRSVVRRIDTWSVLKVSVVFYIAVYCILLVAASLLWFAATQTGLRENVEKVIADLIASGKFHFVGRELLRGGAIGGAMLVVLGTAGNVMLSILYNLISDLVGGVSIVVEERPSAKRPRRVPANDAVKKPPAVEPHRTTTDIAPPEPAKILVPQGERRSEPTHPKAPQHPEAESQAQAPQPQSQSPRPQAPQPEPPPQAESPQLRLPLPVSAPSPEMPDPELLGAERAADGNLEAFGL